MKPILTALAVGLLLGSCAPSTPQARIQQDPRRFESLSPHYRTLAQQGQLARGMPRDGVFIAWGNPSRIYYGSKNGKPTERWDYAGSRPVYSTAFYGGYYGPHGPYGYYGHYGNPWWGVGPDVYYVPYQVASVRFINNRVDSWERIR